MANKLLKVLADVYAAITSLRNRCYEKGLFAVYKSSIAVISVGNLSVGGNAKTPLCLYIVELLKAAGYRPVIISRGYGAKIKKAKLITAADNACSVGDEPFLMSQLAKVPVVVSPKRAQGARLVEEEKLGDVIVLDDAFQHRGLARCLDIISINVGSAEAVSAFCKGEVLPLGRFRENRDCALRRAQVVVFAERKVCKELAPLSKELSQIIPDGIPQFRSFLRAEGLSALLAQDADLQIEPGREVVAFCGLANPQGFFDTLRTQGFNLKASISFADHHAFSASEISKIKEKFPGLTLLCSAKDAVRVPQSVASGVFCLSVSTLMDKPEQFASVVLTAVKAFYAKR